jgi:UDP-N-acetylglucosamine:LPS N-acetylglucosamine transferase
VVIAGGGTAGHVLPGLAIAQALVDRGVVEGSDDVHFVGSRRGIERTLVPTAGFPLTLLPGRGIQRRLAVANVGAILGLGLAGLRAVASWCATDQLPSSPWGATPPCRAVSPPYS